MSRYSERERDWRRMEWVKTQRCAVAVELGSDAYCSRGFADADHAGRHGLGVKCSDAETIPLCDTHHRDKTNLTGHFKGYDAARLRAWLEPRIAFYQDRYERLLAAGPLPF